MNRRIFALATFFTCTILTFNSTTAIAQDDIPVRASGAQRVVVGRATSVTPRWHRNAHGDELIVSDVVLEVEESLKGTSPAALIVEVEGGTMGELTLKVSGLPAFQRGDRAVFFLNELSTGTHVPHDRGRGILMLDRSNRVAGGTLALGDVRRLVVSGR
jgi:hypothetical protein